MKENNNIYLLPGRTGRVDGFIGTTLINLGYDVIGHNIDDSFQKLRFSQQIEIVKNDLKNDFFNKESKIVASSYGAYLFLHAILEMQEFKGKALLFSPILGKSRLRANKPIVYPPRARKLVEYKFPMIEIEVHTGVDDEICDPNLAEEIFNEMEKSKLVLVPNASHQLDREYIVRVLEDFLRS